MRLDSETKPPAADVRIVVGVGGGVWRTRTDLCVDRKPPITISGNDRENSASLRWSTDLLFAYVLFYFSSMYIRNFQILKAILVFIYIYFSL